MDGQLGKGRRPRQDKTTNYSPWHSLTDPNYILYLVKVFSWRFSIWLKCMNETILIHPEDTKNNFSIQRLMMIWMDRAHYDLLQSFVDNYAAHFTTFTSVQYVAVVQRPLLMWFRFHRKKHTYLQKFILTWEKLYTPPTIHFNNRI
jgi:hypothetical protein